jgi:hypothetical protein
MKTLKNVAAFVVAATLLVACGDNATVTPTNDPLAGVTLPTCQTVQNPLTEYWWMGREIGYIENREIDTKSKIYSGQYKGKTIYLFEHFPVNNPTFLINAGAYACNGTGLTLYCSEVGSTYSTGVSLTGTPCKEDKYMPIKKQLANLTLIYQEK